MVSKQTLIGVALAIAGLTAQAECLSDAQTADLFANWQAKTPAVTPEGLSVQDAACSRAEIYALHDGLRDMTVTLADGNGATLGQGKGSDILEHPLNAVVWLAQALAEEGLAMKAGDLISLGSFSPLLPPKPGLKASVTYSGLPGAQPVSVSFK